MTADITFKRLTTARRVALLACTALAGPLAVAVYADSGMRLLAGVALAGVVAAAVTVQELSAVRVVKAAKASTDRADEMEAALEYVSQGIELVDKNRNVTILNKRAVEFLRLPQEFVDTCPTYDDLLRWQKNSGEYKDADKSVKEFVDAGAFNVVNGKYQRTTPEGLSLEIETICLPTGGFCRSFTDVTEREQAARAKDAFFAGMTHEMRTPLNGVIGLADALADTALDKTQTHYVTTMRDSGVSLLKIINDLLDYSKMQADAIELDDVPFDLEQTVGTVVASMTEVGRAKGLAMSSEIDSRLPRRFFGDASRIRQVLFNLVGNAVKFTEHGSVTLHVEQIDDQENDKHCVKFTVTDTGIGISAESMPKLFKAFSQVDASISRRFGGTGLGLVISKRLVTAMGGNITVDSEPGRGTSIAFTVGLRRDRSTVVHRIAKASATTPARSFRILMAEDDSTNRLVATTLLEKMGHTVEVVENGLLAVNAATSKQYDLILMDVMMPEMDGFTATQTIRAAANPIPIIALTANATKEHAEAAKAAGMTDFVTKPITRATLDAAITRVMAGSEAVAAPADPAPAVQPVTVKAEGDTPVLDRKVLNAFLAEMGEENARRMTENFMTDTITRIKRLRDIVNDRASLERETHSLKSSAAIFGFAALSRRAADLESGSRRLSDAEITASVERLSADLADAKQQLAA